MAVKFTPKPWIWPGFCAALVAIGFALPHSDDAGTSLVLYSLVALMMVFVWLFSKDATPSIDKRPEMKLVYGAFALLCLALAVLPMTTWITGKTGNLGGLYDPSMAWLEYIKLGGVVCAFLLGLGLSLNDETAKRVLDALLYMGGAWAVLAIIMHLLDPGGLYGQAKPFVADRLSAAFGSANSAGTLFASLSVMALGRLITRFMSYKARNIIDRIHPGFFGVFFFSLCAMSLTMSRTAILASLICMAMMCMVMLWKKLSFFKMVLMALLVIITVIFIFASPFLTAMERFEKVHTDTGMRFFIYKAHFDIAIKQPWFGFGLGSFNGINNTIVKPDNYTVLALVRTAHSVYLQWFEETGVMGLGALIALNASILWPIYRGAVYRERMSGRIWSILFGYLVFILHGFTDYAFQEPALAIFTAILLGMGLAMTTNSSRRA